MEKAGVEALFADGSELADRLTIFGPKGIEPELELIEPGARDQQTALLLQDVWRYARHYWSIPYQSTPLGPECLLFGPRLSGSDPATDRNSRARESRSWVGASRRLLWLDDHRIEKAAGRHVKVGTWFSSEPYSKIAWKKGFRRRSRTILVTWISMATGAGR